TGKQRPPVHRQSKTVWNLDLFAEQPGTAEFTSRLKPTARRARSRRPNVVLCVSRFVQRFGDGMSKSICVVLVLCLPLCVTAVSRAQNTNSVDIRGTVTDASKALLPDV